jgi:RNA polymerase sigma factor (sigma-70 family)
MDLPAAPIGSWPSPIGSWSTDAARVERTFTQVFESERPALLRWLRMRMRDDAAAEDCCQEAFARLLCELRSGRQLETPGAWLHLVARNLLISRARHAQVVARGERYAAPAVSGDPTAGAILGREQFQAVRLALETMPCGERDLLLRAARGQTGAQLADRLGVSQVAVRTRLFRARRRLRTMVDDGPAIPAGASLVSGQP